MMQKKQRPTLQDIADRVGVTKMTVSRFLRDPSKVSEAVGVQIDEVVKELGYVPNRAPDILSKAKSYSIGVLLPSLTNQVFDEVLRGIEGVIEPNGYQAMIAHYGYGKHVEEKRIETLLGYNVDGIILSESYHTERSKKILNASGIPIVEIMDSISQPLQQAVGFDNIKASQNATRELINRGRKRIAYLAARMDERTKQKIKGYEQVMVAQDLKPLVITTMESSSYTLGATLMKNMLAEHPEVDGIICTNDDIAIGALYECQRQNVGVPKDVSIVGFHGHNISSVIKPTLATVITPREEIGKIAAEHLMQRITDPLAKIEQRCIDLETQFYFGETL
ncbi:substrate-binding domain-containing protein [Vibrio sp. PID23_8]|jgi:LacI family gluconate utilization system Gnt-I transcriptional repressor|uniref:substrate-binding domain-containing protein n=1 Tax=unclassified Vibrio TaxID=2614977 RepID=UPI000E69AB39|nr:substrate-binding domain-containing protein [Vibrio sp. PID23_8]RIZ54969.1 transcriptional regulator [Vibrio sp. PID23_8]